MTWHEHLTLEVEATFRSLSGAQHWDSLNEAIYAQNIRRAEWRSRRRPRTTAYDRKYGREHQRLRYRRLKQTIVAVRVCVHCRRFFALTAYREMKGAGRSCGRLCASNNQAHAYLVEYAGDRLSVTAWCVRLGISRNTFKSRRIRGLSIHDALFVPICTEKSRVARSAA